MVLQKDVLELSILQNIVFSYVVNFVQGYYIQKYCCVYDTCLYRKQLEDILANLKEKPDVGTLLLVSH